MTVQAVKPYPAGSGEAVKHVRAVPISLQATPPIQAAAARITAVLGFVPTAPAITAMTVQPYLRANGKTDKIVPIVKNPATLCLQVRATPPMQTAALGHVIRFIVGRVLSVM